jgi:hypothetical protein
MTVRTDAAILALFPNNTSGQINPVDLRDMWDTIVSKTPVSVKQHGAVGNGSTDDAAAIQAAIDAVSAAGGGTVFAPASNTPYMIGSTVVFKSNTILEGDFPGTVFKLINGANVDMFSATGVTPLFGLRNICLHGNRAQQNGNAAKFGINIAVSDQTIDTGGSPTPATFGANSSLGPGTLEHPWYRIEHVVMVEIDGAAFKTDGAAGIWRNVTLVNSNGKGAEITGDGSYFTSVNLGGTAHEGMLVSGTNNMFTECKVWFNGTGLNPANGTFGNYASGYGFHVTGRGNQFGNCQAQDTDGPGFWITGNDTLISSAYLDNCAQLEAWSVHLGQTPTRGGGYTGDKVGFNLQGADNCLIQGQVTARGVVNGQIAAELVGFIRLQGAANNNVGVIGGTVAALAGGATDIRLSSYTGTNNRILTRSGLLAP